MALIYRSRNSSCFVFLIKEINTEFGSSSSIPLFLIGIINKKIDYLIVFFTNIH